MYFQALPKILYNIQGDNKGNYVVVTNINFRVSILDKIKNNVSFYNPIMIEAGDRPDMLAEKYYGDPSLHWVIFLANDIINPLHEWPKNYEEFNNFIVSKYGSIQNATQGIAYYEKVITRENILQNHTETIKLQIDSDEYSDLTDTADYTAYSTNNHVTIHETIYRNAVSFYDYEDTLNESRRVVKMIRPDYIPQIINEFNKLTSVDLYRPGYRAFA